MDTWAPVHNHEVVEVSVSCSASWLYSYTRMCHVAGQRPVGGNCFRILPSDID